MIFDTTAPVPAIPSARRQVLRAIAIIAASMTWLCLVIAGMKLIAEYKTTPGTQGATPTSWPADSTLPLPTGRNTLVMFVHPKCPCTRASLSELNIVMNESGERASAFIVFVRPDGVEADWERTDTWDTAGRIPHATRLVDPDGREAKRFGGLTSGHVVLYDAQARLLFSGGITDSRGHAGDNVGRQTVQRLIAGQPVESHDHAVFGCGLHDPAPNGDLSSSDAR